MTATLQVGAQVADGWLATVHRGSLGGRAVAVKRARGDVPGAADALRREARVLGSASHPAIVPVLALLDDGRAPALVLGWADGGRLDDLLADGPLSDEDLVHILRPVAGGLDALHLAGVAHLDVTPRNVLLAAAGPLLIDPAPPGAGTPGFTDPVVAAGGPASARSDVFGLAACAHVALTGRPPRPIGGVAAGCALAAGVADVVATGLHPDPSRRPASPSAFVDLLEAGLARAGELPGAPPGAPPGSRPMLRAASASSAPARTWPFDRWQEQADAARARDEAVRCLTRAPGPFPPRRPRRRLVAVGALLACCAVGGVAARSAGVRIAAGGSRTSAPDDPRRPPAARPPPAATPGGHT